VAINGGVFLVVFVSEIFRRYGNEFLFPVAFFRQFREAKLPKESNRK
jgi:hypothetical protein